MFPVTVLKQSGRAESSSGGKDFHLILIVTNDGRALYINRWGKKSQWGNGWKCEYFTNSGDATSAYAKKYHEKLSKEYRDHFINKNTQVGGVDELRKNLGPQLIAAIGAERWGQLIPGVDTSKMREGSVETDEDDHGFRINRRDPKLIEQPKPVEETVEQRNAANPLYGVWG